MSEPKWKKEKEKNLNLSLDDRRKKYSVKDFLNVNMIDPWNSYIIRHKDIESKKTTLDDLTEFQKIKINNALNKELAQKVSIFEGDITKLEVS